MADRQNGRRGVDASNYDLDGERLNDRQRQEPADDRTPVERRRAGMGDGVGAVFKWWAWLAGQYAVTFILASIMGFIAIILIPGAALHFLAPDVVARGTVEALAILWILFSLLFLRVWMKNRMASKGVNVTSFPF